MKQPTETDFEVQVSRDGVVATFKPTKSTYSFYRFGRPDDIKRFGPIEPEAHSLRHAGPMGDTGDYLPHEVELMAYRLGAGAVA